MNAPHLAAYMQATDGAVAQFTLHEMSQVSSGAQSRLDDPPGRV